LKRAKSQRIGLVIALVLAALFGSFGPRAYALLRPTNQFRAWPSDARIRYEVGAERMAEQVASALPTAIQTIEQRQFRPFAAPPTLYVCASLKTYASFGGDASSGGYVVNGRLFISPKPQNTPERIPRLLTHELSHLHLEQQLGAVRWMRQLPMWFQEGLAAYVSGGAGAEQVSDADARRALAAGRVLAPETVGGIFYRSTPSTFGMHPHLFYREGAMFLQRQEVRDSNRFRSFLLAVEDGVPLDAAFRGSYGESLEEAWKLFVEQQKAVSGGAGP
jgi:hypothetical protein